jgi:hypothetical protein
MPSSRFCRFGGSCPPRSGGVRRSLFFVSFVFSW